MKTVTYGDTSKGVVLIQPEEKGRASALGEEYSLIRGMAGDGFCLVAAEVEDWNRDLSPWEAPPVFGSEGFAGGAEETLAQVLELVRGGGKRYAIGGYSLAGLFALWAAYRTDAFRGVAAASPSVWFPGFVDLMRQRPILAKRVYLSLGDREEKTRNRVMAQVGDRIREAHALLKERGTDCELEWNSGNHFAQPALRTAKAFAWVLGGMPRGESD